MPSFSKDDMKRVAERSKDYTLVLLCRLESECSRAVNALVLAGVAVDDRSHFSLTQPGVFDLKVVVLDIRIVGATRMSARQ
jgi:hypothetical protein